MDPRKFLKKLAREMGLLRNDTTEAETVQAEKVSKPANFQHRVHVALDEDSGGFIGLPPQWKQVVGKNELCRNSSIKSGVSALGKNLRRLHRQDYDNNTSDGTFSNAKAGNFSRLSASLNTPRSRASVADNQDLIIERLKRELREYKAKNDVAFNELSEDLQSSRERMFNSTRSLNYHATETISPHRVTELTNRGLGNKLSGIRRNHSSEFDESVENLEFFVPSKTEPHSISNGNVAKSSQKELSTTKNLNANGNILCESPTKLTFRKPNGNARVSKRPESEV
ncbi:uncharacterized protein [Montipora foliosa]|uniref:uncharacterized protein n=1 Tax=Montipora foliosa TaxID=591990 RepID=UPI0035F20F6C